MQGVSQRIILDHSKAKRSIPYTMFSEIFIGISFGITPMIAGFLTAIDLKLNFVFLSGLLFVLAIILIIKHYKFRRLELAGKFLSKTA